MAIIPRFRRQTVGVSPALPSENLTVPASAFENQQFKALSSLALSGTKLSKFLSDRSDQVEAGKDKIIADGAYNRLYDAQSQPFNEARITRGVNASGATERYTVQFDELASDGFKELTNDRQRTLYFDRVDALKRNRNGFLSTHEAGEFQTAMDNNLSANTTESVNEAGINFNNDGIYDESRMKALASRRDQMIFKGAGQQQIENELKSFNGKLQSQRITQVADTGQLEKANTLLNLHKKELTPQQFNDLKTKLDGKFFRERVQNKTDELHLNSKGDEQFALDSAHKQLSGKEEEEVVRSLRQRFADERNIKSRTDKKVFGSLYTLIRNSTTLDQAMRIAGQGVNPNQINALERQARLKYSTQNKPIQKSTIGLTLNLMERIDKSNDGRLKETDPLFIADITDVETASAGKLTVADTNRVRKYLEDGGESGRLGLNKVIPIWEFYNNKPADLKDEEVGEAISRLRTYILERAASGRDITQAEMLELGKSFFETGVIGKAAIVETGVFGVFGAEEVTFEEAVRTGKERQFFVRSDDIEPEERLRAEKLIAAHNQRPEVRNNPSRQWAVTEENISLIVTRKFRGIGRALKLQ